MGLYAIYIKLNHRVVDARWDKSISRWRIKVEDVENRFVIDDECDVLLSCAGILNEWKWPDIKGLDQFKGPMLHSARWDTAYDFKAKTVAVIGAGSSAIHRTKFPTK